MGLFELSQTLSICIWTLLAFICGGIMLITGLVHWHNQNKRDKKFEEGLADEAAPANGNA